MYVGTHLGVINGAVNGSNGVCSVPTGFLQLLQLSNYEVLGAGGVLQLP